MPTPDPARLLADLVRLPSVNPMGKIVPEANPYYEFSVTNYLLELLTTWGLPTKRVEVHPGRENLLTRLDATTAEPHRPLILLDVHQDTVPVEGMTIDPFSGEIREGKLYGRGACDVKGGMASILTALARLIDAPLRKSDVVVAFTINEEFGFSGAKKLVETWSRGRSRFFVPRIPDAIIVAEPTRLDVVVAHKGVIRWRCTAHGRAGHSSQPQLCQNAIYVMARAISVLERMADHLAKTPLDPLLGAPSLSIGMISGGVSGNTVPDRCTIEIERRTLPEESPEEVYRSTIAEIEKGLAPGDRLEHAEPFITSSGLACDRNVPLAARLSHLAQRIGAGKQIGVPFGTNAAPYHAAGAPVVVFGPGDIAQAHTADEWIELSQVEQAARILEEFCLEFKL